MRPDVLAVCWPSRRASFTAAASAASQAPSLTPGCLGIWSTGAGAAAASTTALLQACRLPAFRCTLNPSDRNRHVEQVVCAEAATLCWRGSNDIWDIQLEQAAGICFGTNSPLDPMHAQSS